MGTVHEGHAGGVTPVTVEVRAEGRARARLVRRTRLFPRRCRDSPPRTGRERRTSTVARANVGKNSRAGRTNSRAGRTGQNASCEGGDDSLIVVIGVDEWVFAPDATIGRINLRRRSECRGRE